MTRILLLGFFGLGLGCVVEEVEDDAWGEGESESERELEIGELDPVQTEGCFVGASSGFHTVADEDACTRLCFFDDRKGSFWVPGNIHGNCKCVACGCSGCQGACIPVETTSIFGPDATCECHEHPLGLDGEMVCS